jgi:hypothetical protein
MSWKQPIDVSILNEFKGFEAEGMLYILLIIKACNKQTWINYRGKPALLERGQVIFGRNEYSLWIGTSPSTAERKLKNLEKRTSKITSKPNENYTIVTINNYDELVSFEQANEQAVNKQRTSGEQAVNTSKIIKNIYSVENVKKKKAANIDASFLKNQSLGNCTSKIQIQSCIKKMDLPTDLKEKILLDVKFMRAGDVKKDLKTALELIDLAIEEGRNNGYHHLNMQQASTIIDNIQKAVPEMFKTKDGLFLDGVVSRMRNEIKSLTFGEASKYLHNHQLLLNDDLTIEVIKE